MRSRIDVSRVALILLGLFWLTAQHAAAADFKFISTDEVKRKLDSGEKFLFVNALSPIEFDEGTIPGSINIPSSRVTATNPALPADKGALLVFFCKGPKCDKSRVAADKAAKLGYTNIMIYNEGIPEWAKRGLPMETHVQYPDYKPERLAPKALQAQLASVTVLDIRGPGHIKELGRIKEAQIIEMDDLRDKYAALPKGKKVVVLDHAAKQVNIAAKFLKMKGYDPVAVLDGGMLAWIREGLPVEK